MRKLIVFSSLILFSMAVVCWAAETEANDVPVLKLSHFPNRMHAFVWRNWESVSIDRMAKVLNTAPANIEQIGLSMGLPKSTAPFPEYMERGYLSLIFRNWNLLSYDQLLVLLGWDSEKLDLTLRTDDSCAIKLGGMRPTCPPLKYIAQDDAAKKKVC